MNHSQKSFSLFLIIWTGQLLSRIGSGISAFALGICLFQQTGSTAAYSFLLLCAFLPPVLLAPVGGGIADRKDRKLMMVMGNLASVTDLLDEKAYSKVSGLIQLAEASRYLVSPVIA